MLLCRDGGVAATVSRLFPVKVSRTDGRNPLSRERWKRHARKAPPFGRSDSILGRKPVRQAFNAQNRCGPTFKCLNPAPPISRIARLTAKTETFFRLTSASCLHAGRNATFIALLAFLLDPDTSVKPLDPTYAQLRAAFQSGKGMQ